MQLQYNAMVVVADGAGLRPFRNSANDGEIKLVEKEPPDLGKVPSAGGRHHSSTANPDRHTVAEDAHAAAIARWLRSEVLAGRLEHLVVIAPPRLLGEMRRHYTSDLAAVLAGELAKELVRHPVADIESAIADHR
jgi:protein required for attachment to host cells